MAVLDFSYARNLPVGRRGIERLVTIRILLLSNYLYLGTVHSLGQAIDNPHFDQMRCCTGLISFLLQINRSTRNKLLL